jgi:hypothetical protein
VRHITLLLDGSDLDRRLCAICAETCRRCADSCREMAGRAA